MVGARLSVSLFVVLALKGNGAMACIIWVGVVLGLRGLLFGSARWVEGIFCVLSYVWWFRLACGLALSWGCKGIDSWQFV